MKTFYYNAHDANHFGPPKGKPVLFQFDVKAKTQEEADKMASSIAQHKNGGTFCHVSRNN